MKFNLSTTALCAALGVVSVMPEAVAAPVTHFSNSISLISAESHSAEIDDCTTLECTRDPETYEEQFDLEGGLIATSRTGDFFEGTATANAQGDLSAGELKAFSEVTANGNIGSLGSFSRVDIGDSFRAYTDDSPFSWASDTEVAFSFDISGLAELDGATSNSRLNLFIFAPGDLDAYAQWLNGDGALPEALFQFSYSLGEGAQVFPFTTEAITTFPDTISAVFAPGGDFDWSLNLITDTSLSTTTFPDGYGLSDFSNTVVASYAGPLGAQTFSASGLFPGTVALSDAPSEVPIPGALMLMMPGLAGLGWLGKRKKKA